MATVARLSVDFQTNVAQIANDLTQIRSSYTKTYNDIVSGAKKAAQAVSLYMAARLVTSALSSADALKSVAEQADMTAEAIQRLRVAGGENTLDYGGVDAGLIKLNQTIGQAVEGNKSAIESFARLGITLDDLRTKSKEDILNMIADGMAKVETQGQRAAISVGLFGKNVSSGFALMLKDGSKALDEYSKKLSDVGVFMSNDLAIAAGKAKGEINQVSAVMRTGFETGLLDEFSGQFHKIGDALLPLAGYAKDFGSILGLIISDAIDLGAEILKWPLALFEFSGGFETLRLVAEVAMNAIKLGFYAIEDTAYTFSLTIYKVLQGIDDAFTALLRKMGKDAKESGWINESVQQLEKLKAEAEKKMIGAGRGIVTSADRWGGYMRAEDRAAYKKDLEELRAAENAVARGSVPDSVKNKYDVTIKGTKDLVKETEKLGKATKDTKKDQDDLFSALFRNLDKSDNILQSIGQNLLSWFSGRAQSGGISGITSGFSEIGSVLGSLFGGFRADGGHVMAGKSYIGGERGIEKFTPGVSGYVTPNHELGGASGRGGSMTVNIHPSADVEVSTQRSPSGDLDVFIESKINKAMASGATDKTMRTRYGARRTLRET